LKLKPLRYLGKVSYGLYVFHIPVFLFVASALQNPLARLAFEFALTLGIASLSWHFFENPILRLKTRLT
jgi:peptidoglycan/LPS O-acetylase OafA/YrhL